MHGVEVEQNERGRSRRASVRSFPRFHNSQPAPGAERFALWQLPHLLGLDAPLVAVVWQLWWAQALDVQLRWVHHVVLALAVWMIYLADRLADAAALRPACDDAKISARHRFAWRYRQPLTVLVACVIVTLVALTPRWLTTREFVAGCALFAVQAAYFGWVHFRREREAKRTQSDSLRKEAWVGGSFALGTIWFSGWCVGTQVSAAMLAALCGLGSVCFLNCALISDWERSAAPRETGRPSLRTACGVVTVLALVCGTVLGRLFWPLAFSAAGLWWLDLARGWLPRETRRVLADIVLLAPLPLLFAL